MQETEKFIEAVERYPCLWNIFIPTYKCRETKDAAWREIVKHHTIVSDIDAAKDKWKKLKDAFREALNKRKKDIRLGKIHKIGRAYKYQHVLKFLIPILENRSIYNNETADQSEEFLSNMDEDANETHLSSHSEQDAMAFVQVEPDIHEPPVLSSAQRRGYKRNHSNEFLEFLMEDNHRREAIANDRHQTVSHILNEFDAIDRFFLSMAESAKKLPEQLQLMVKRKVFNAVIEAEEENMKNMYKLSKNTVAEEVDVKPVIVHKPN